MCIKKTAPKCHKHVVNVFVCVIQQNEIRSEKQRKQRESSTSAVENSTDSEPSALENVEAISKMIDAKFYEHSQRLQSLLSQMKAQKQKK